MLTCQRTERREALRDHELGPRALAAPHRLRPRMAGRTPWQQGQRI
jgi:hypothetical protein